MTANITTRLTAQEGYERARDAVAAILALELQNQVALAMAAGADASPFDVDVYSERSNPWPTDALSKPVVNVWFTSADYSKKASSPHPERGHCVLNVDVYASCESEETSEGYSPADASAALLLQSVMRSVRQILMSEQYTYLGSPRRAQQWCFGRWISGVSIFDISDTNYPTAHVSAGRIALDVETSESVAMWQGSPIEIVGVTVTRGVGGIILLQSEYNYLG